MTETERPLRADARRNREKILASAAELFARLGTEAQMDQIAEHSGLGLGTLYRHFPTKEALLAAIVARRFEDLANLARAAEQVDDPGEAFEILLRSYLESAVGDADFPLITCGIMSTMYYKPGGTEDGWRRHLDLVARGARIAPAGTTHPFGLMSLIFPDGCG